MLALALAASLLPGISASRGDGSPMFRDCVGVCRQKWNCPLSPSAYSWSKEKCFRCRDDCIWKTVEAFQGYNQKIPQFFGKWPFYSISFKIGGFFFLIQEPASTLFSILNFCSIWRLHYKMDLEVSPNYRCATVWRIFCFVGMCAWMASMIFHSFDVKATEYLDYCCASAMIFYSLFTAISFTFTSLQTRLMGRFFHQLVAFVLLIFYLLHIEYLFSAPRFDYSYNMKVCVGLSIFTSFIYLVWCWREYKFGRWRPSIHLNLIWALLIGWVGAAFEILDFSPIFWVFDSHSIFHLITIPVPLFLARFFCLQAKSEMKLALFDQKRIL